MAGEIDGHDRIRHDDGKARSRIRGAAQREHECRAQGGAAYGPPAQAHCKPKAKARIAMGKATKDFCKAVRACQQRGDITKQQARTLIGQAKAGDLSGAMRGVERIYSRG